MSNAHDMHRPGGTPAGIFSGESWGEWFDRHSRTFFIAPAVTLILVFAIFPTFYSIVFALSRVRFTADGLNFRFVWFRNFEKQFTGNEQIHFLGRVSTMGVFGWIFFLVVTAAVLWWLYRYLRREFWWPGFVGRLISSFAAPVIGGAMLSGGHVSVGGTFFGVVIIAIITQALVLFAIDPFVVQIVLGGLILWAVGINRWRALRVAKLSQHGA